MTLMDHDTTVRSPNHGSALLPAPIILAGMHRSGTSFVASFVRAAGVHLGEHLIEASAGNELGHFENVAFVEFHQRQLSLHGYAPQGWIVDAGMKPNAAARAEALGLVAEQARSTPWGWKDPRATLFLDFWLSVVPTARFVLIYREPAEVVTSLFRRGDAAMRMSPETAASSWICHNQRILHFVRAHRERCVLVNLAGVVTNPQRFLSLVGERCGIVLDRNVSSPYSKDLLHTQPENAPLTTLVRHFVPKVGDTYDELERYADMPGTYEKPVADVRAAFFNYWIDVADGSWERALAYARDAHENERRRNERLLARLLELEGNPSAS